VARIVVDTNVIVSAMFGSASANRAVVRACLERKAQPVIGEALFLEYEDVLARPERGRLLDAFLSVCEWVDVYFGWRPNLSDEGDNHLIELAVAGGAGWIVTSNAADFMRAELKFPGVRIAKPTEFMAILKGEATP
jgi:predicted nucleic acid-binding protein